MSNAFSLRVPKYRKHKATGQAAVVINGRYLYLGKFGSAASKSEYNRIVAEYLHTGGVPSQSRQHEVSVSEVMVAYLRFARCYYRKNGGPTREFGMIRDSCRFIKPLYGRTPAVAFGPLRLKTVRQKMIEADHSRKYINKNVERIRRMFKWAAGEELVPASVPQALSMVAGLRIGRSNARETAPVMPVDDKIVEATLPYLPEVVMNMVMAQRFCGMRPSEICSMRPCDIDQSGKIWIYRPESHKTEHHGRERQIFIGHRAQGVLLKFLARDPQSYCFRPCDSESKRRASRHAARTVPLSCGNRPGSNRVRKPKRSAGEHYCTDAYRRAIHRACDKAFPHSTLSKLKASELSHKQRVELRKWQSGHRWSPNQLRHTAATQVRREYGLEAAQVILGHAQANVTQIYAERDATLGVKIASEIG